MNKEEFIYNIKYGYRVSYIFVGIFIALFLLMEITGSSTNVETLIKFGANYPPLTMRGQFYRLITSSFLHIGIFHLLIDVLSFIALGKYIEDIYGIKKFIGIYAITAIGAGLFSLIMALITGNLAVSAGVSGVIFGFAGVLLGNAIRKNTYSYDLGIDTTMLLIVVGFNLLLGFAIPGIDNSAHIGGLITGIACGFFFEPLNSFHPSKMKKNIESGVSYIGLTLIILSFIFLLYGNLK